MDCKNCGRPLEPNVQFCGFCGTQVEPQKEDKKFKEKKNSKLNNSTKIALLMMFLAFCILGVSVFIFVSRTQQTPLKPAKATQASALSQETAPVSNDTYSQNIGETLQIDIPDNIIVTEPQANTGEGKTNYDKYGKYIDKNVEVVLNDFPNAEKSSYESGAYGAYELKITNDVGLIYDNDICTSFYCLATDIYPNIANEAASMSKDEFENYLGLPISFDPNSIDGDSIIHYIDNGYHFWVYCEKDGTIVFDKTQFLVKNRY